MGWSWAPVPLQAHRLGFSASSRQETHTLALRAQAANARLAPAGGPALVCVPRVGYKAAGRGGRSSEGKEKASNESGSHQPLLILVPRLPGAFLPSHRFPRLVKRSLNRCPSADFPLLWHQGKPQRKPHASPRPPSPGGAPASARCTRSGCPGTSAPWPGLRRPPGPVSASGLWKGFQKSVRVSEKKAAVSSSPRRGHPVRLCRPLRTGAGGSMLGQNCQHFLLRSELGAREHDPLRTPAL